MTPRYASPLPTLLPTLLAAIGAGSLLAAGGCGAVTQPSAPNSTEGLEPSSSEGPLPTSPHSETSAAPTDAVSSVSDTNSETIQCEYGTAQEFCLNEEQMVSQARHGVGQVPLDPPRSDEAIEAGWDANHCMRHDWIATGCCNPAEASGVPRGDGTCCYVACEGVCCGRPFMVNGSALLAGLVGGNSWILSDVGNGKTREPECSVNLTALDGAARHLLGDLWLEDARMEHASIASFAQFSLDLLRLGAPPELIRDSQLAGLDEIRHAQFAFSMAERITGVARAPDALALGMLQAHSAHEAIAAAIIEGCVGETLAAGVLAEQARRCTDPALAEQLARMSMDELRHAELAWRFVAWGTKRFGGAAGEVAAATFRTALNRLPEPPEVSATDEQLHAAGRISAQEWRLVVEGLVSTVLKPAAATLLSAPLRRDAASHAAPLPC